MKCILVKPNEPAVTAEVDMDDLIQNLGLVSFIHPYYDPVCLACDDNGIANKRLPNRTVNGQIIPGPFYVLGTDSVDELTDLSPDLIDKYLREFAKPELFPPGKWEIDVHVIEEKFNYVLNIVSSWVPVNEASDDKFMQ